MIPICDGKIIDGELVDLEKCAQKPTLISEEELEALVEEFKDYYVYVEGTETSSYDNSDDERVEDSSSEWSFGHFYELAPLENSKHLLRIDGKIRGVVFFVRNSKSYHDEYFYEAFLFDNSIKNVLSMGYSASHSSQYTYVEKVSLVRRDDPRAPKSARPINLRQSTMYPSI